MPKPTVLLFGNPNPQMQVTHPDGNVTSRPAEHLNDSVTRVEFWDGFDDAKNAELALSTNNDRLLGMIGRGLAGADKRYAIALNELEQIVAAHTGGDSPTFISSTDPQLAKAAAKHFGCPVNDLIQTEDGRQIGGPTALVTNGGRDNVHAQIASTSAPPATANYMALTTDATAAAATDTTLTSEETTNGLARAQATYAHTAGTNTTTLTKTFTYTGSTSKVIAKIGIFNAASVGTLVFETLLSATATLTTSGDSLTVTETITAG